MSVLLEVDDLKISARRDDDSLLPIVKGVSFNVSRGEVVALIGESGSGKTTIALSALGYTKPGLEFAGGEVRLESEDVITMEPNQLRALRGQRVAYLAQSAAATFNPALRWMPSTSFTWSHSTNVTTRPSSPARAVRPDRWRYVFGSSGGS